MSPIIKSASLSILLLGGALVSSQTPVPAALGGLRGTLLDASGKPVVGALVGAVPYEANALSNGERAAMLVRSGKDGAFAFRGLPLGKYGVTATHRSHASAYRGELQVKGGELLETQSLQMGKEGTQVVGRIQGAPLSTLKDQTLKLIRVSEVNGDVFHVPLREGRFEARMAPGTYLVAMDVKGHIVSQQQITVPGAASPLSVKLERVQDRDQAPLAVVDAWIRRKAVPLKTVEAGHGFEDLMPLKAMVGSARVVALGEATHGTREFFQLKHRMLEFLVSEMGFTTFAIEANQPEARAVNAYVLRGEGDPAKALSGLYFWTWDTEEVLEQIRWMRRWNEDPAHPKKITFQGFDMQMAPIAFKEAAAYLDRVAPEQARVLRSDASAGWELRDAPKEKKQGLLAMTQRWLGVFDGNREAWSKATSTREFDIARQDMRVLTQYAEGLLDTGGAVRDRAMADNTRWILDQEGPAGKVVVWAHNAHVSKAGSSGIPSQGTHLASALKQNYVVFGFAFNEGGFQAVQPQKGLNNHLVEPAPIGTLDAALARAGHDVLALDLRQRPATGPVGEWFQSLVETRSIGSVYDPARPKVWFVAQRLPEHYDGLLFVKRTTAARPNPSGRRQPPKATVGKGPVNFDFEEGELGGIPKGWTLTTPGFEARVEEGATKSGLRRVSLRRDSDQKDGFGILVQSVDAEPYRGKRVRLSGWLRSEGWGRAMAWLRVDLKEGMGFFDNMQGRPVTSPDWQPFVIEGDVDADAISLNLGLLFSGEGGMGADGFKLEVVEAAQPSPSPAPARR